MSKTTSNYVKIKASLDIKPIVEKYCKLCSQKAAEYSPVGESKDHYKDNWTYDINDKGNTCEGVVRNKKYQISHLIEYGHRTRNKKGYVQPHPHLEKAFNDVRDQYIEELKRCDIDIKKG